jgi:hypothetical protein
MMTMRAIHRILVRFSMLVMFLILSSPIRADQNPQLVSMIELIANAEKFDGKLIQVSGFLSLQDEDHAIYFSEQIYDHRFTENAEWIDIHADMLAAVKKYDGHYGYVIGIFTSKKCGHSCLYRGSIKYMRLGLMY